MKASRPEIDDRLLQATGLSVVRSGALILDSLHLVLSRGELWALCGPNGAGKTTLLRTLAGLETFEERRPPELSRPWRAGLIRTGAAVFAPAVPLDATNLAVIDLIRSGAHLWGTSWGHWNAAETASAFRLLDEFEIRDLADRPYSRLSLGEKRLCDLCRAFYTRAEILLFDEPTANLDLRHRLLFWTRARSLCRAGHAVMASVHDLGEARQNADRALVLDHGLDRGQGPPSSVLTPDLVRSVWNVGMPTDPASRLTL